MKKEFFNRIEKDTYTRRKANPSWLELVAANVEVKDKKAADVGAGGGIYSMALADLGAASVIGIDISENMIAGARENCGDYPNITFQLGTSSHSGLGDGVVDILLERALIHHLKEAELADCFHEAKRVLADDGVFIIQDRTIEDCTLAGSAEHLRGYFFEIFPELIEKDIARRHSVATVNTCLAAAGFSEVKVVSFWEKRKTYQSIAELKEEIIKRKGRSILFELDDNQIETLADQVAGRINATFPLTEKERWTIWFARN